MATHADAQLRFVDVTDGSGVEYQGESYGGAWGDANGDRLPDLFVSHHRNPSGLYINLADGTFEDRGYEIDAWQATPRSDVHGGTWADYNNDGLQDLVITAGAKNDTQFLVNNGRVLTDRIADFTFDHHEWGGRYPFWFDFDNDGLLDLGVIVQGDKTQLLQQRDNDYVRRNNASGHTCTNGDFALLADLTMDGFPDWICVNSGALPERIYDTTVGLPFLDRGDLSESLASIVDAAIADFDGDQLVDIFALRGKVRINGAEIVGPQSIEAHLTNTGATESGLTFRSGGRVSIELHWSGPNVRNVYIGADGRHPRAAAAGEPIRFTLSPDDATVVGLAPHDPAVDRGVYVGYEPATQTWSYFNSAGAGSGGSFSYTYTYIDSNEAVSDLQVLGISNTERPRQPALLEYGGAAYTNRVAGSGLDHTLLCSSVAAADFDNDADVDLYLVCRDAVSNLPNRLYLNDGTGRFVPAGAPFGAEGPVGPGTGLGENVITSDYDVDGFMDLFVTNGLKLYPSLPGYDDGGPDRLFRNLGNGNRWLEFDLTGTVSNRDGLGATVTVTAGGKTQRRDQNGGYHRWAQHDRRLHFGLGAATTASVTVRWPSGTIDTFVNVPANRLYEIVEGNPLIVPVEIPSTTPPSDCDLTSGAPAYDPAADRAVFLWRDDCASRHWNVRVTGGSGSTFEYTGAVVSGAALTNVTGVGLEASDVLDLNGDGTRLAYGLTVGSGRQDGFAFRIDAAAATCFGVDANATTAYVGPLRQARSLPFDLRTLGPCSGSGPTLSVDDVSVTENVPGGAASFTVRLSTAASVPVSVSYATSDGTATAPSDYLQTSGTLTFAAGETTKTISVPIVDDNGPEPVEEFTVRLSSPANASLGDFRGTGTIIDDEPSACGEPAIDRATDHALFIWQDCISGLWSLRVTAGGQYAAFRGSIRANAAFNAVTPFSIESSDLFDFATDPSRIDFELRVGNTGQDGFDFRLPAGARACLALESPPAPLLMGLHRTGVSTPIDLVSLGSCSSTSAIPLTQWQNASGGVSTSANTLTYAGSPTGWKYNTVISPALSALGYGDAFEARWTIGSNPAGSTWVVGLGVLETGPNWRDIDYGLRSSGGELRVYETGTWRTTAGTLATGDVIAIRVSPGLVEYLLNSAVVYSTAVAGSPAYYVDTSFNSGAISLDVTVAGPGTDTARAHHN